jgi:Protein of unknown function (DUF2442)
MPMTKVIQGEPTGGHTLRLIFSDGINGLWDAAPLLASRATSLTTPLREDPAEFARAFIESGALAWPNGLELAPWPLWDGLNRGGLLMREAKAA